MKCSKCGRFATYEQCHETMVDVDEIGRNNLTADVIVELCCSVCGEKCREWKVDCDLKCSHTVCPVDDETYEEEFGGQMYDFDVSCDFMKVPRGYRLELYGTGNCMGCGRSFDISAQIDAMEMEIESSTQ